MKRIFLLLLFAACNFILPAQTASLGTQRMQIPASALNGLSVSAATHQVPLIARCLDEGRDLPKWNEESPLNNILKGGENAYVQFADGSPTKTLAQLLASGAIKILGTREADARSYLRAALTSTDLTISYFPLHLVNKTGKSFKITCLNDLQVSAQKEPAVDTYGASTQEEIWVNTNLSKLKELGKISEEDYNSVINSGSAELKQTKLWYILVTSHVNVSTDPNGSHWIEEALKNKAADALKRSAEVALKNKTAVALKVAETRFENQRAIDLFRKYNIGIQGKTAEEIINNYVQASGLIASQPWEAIEANVTKDFNERVYYRVNKGTGAYIKFLKSRKNNHILYKYTDFVNRNLDHFEEGLKATTIDRSSIHLLNFLDASEDSRTLETLKGTFGDRYSNFSIGDYGKLKELIISKKIKYMFCLGHYSAGKIFTKVKGRIVEFDIAMVNRIAEKLGVKVFYLGCQSSLASGGKTGTTVAVNSIKILNVLNKSINNAGNMDDFLSFFKVKDDSEYSFVYEFDETTGLVKAVITNKTFTNTREPYYEQNAPGVVVIFPKFFLNFLPVITQTNNDEKNHS